MKIYNDQQGAVHLLVLGACVVAVLAGVGAWVYSHQNSNSTPVKLKDSVQNHTSSTTYKPLDEADVQSLQKAQASSQPAASAPVAKAETKPKATTPPKAAATQTPVAPTNPGEVSFSSDGCLVTGKGDPGWTFEVGAYTGTKGGSVSYTLPASGTLTKSSGGFKGMYAYGKFSNPQNINILMEAVPITADQCPAAG
jgi:cytoskeletal protein RodZ